MRTFKRGDTIWHGSRYWKSDGLEEGEVLGWNTNYLAYTIHRITGKQIVIFRVDGSEKIHELRLKRDVMERIGKQYHSRFHEYFYAEKPKPESKEWNWGGYGTRTAGAPRLRGIDGASALGLRFPFTRADVRRAYKRLAKTVHPDLGGTNEAFRLLKDAHDAAMMCAQY